jgi:hypothetical protein
MIYNVRSLMLPYLSEVFSDEEIFELAKDFASGDLDLQTGAHETLRARGV